MSTKITRNKSQHIGTLGESIVQLTVDKNENWISRKLSNDFGIDFELELCNPDISGQFIKVQVKSSEKLNEKSKLIIARVSKKLLNYSFDCRLPVIIVFVDVSQNKAYYCWLQEWLERYFPNGEFKSHNKSTFNVV